MQWTKDNYVLTDDNDLLKLSEIERLLKQSYWANGYSAAKIERLIKNSCCLGLYLNGCLVGFARMVTDKETVTTITDFIIDAACQDQGLGSWLMKCLTEHPELSQTSMTLGTQDKDSFYERFGFERNGSFTHRSPRPPMPKQSDRPPHRRPGFPPLRKNP